MEAAPTRTRVVEQLLVSARRSTGRHIVAGSAAPALPRVPLERTGAVDRHAAGSGFVGPCRGRSCCSMLVSQQHSSNAGARPSRRRPATSRASRQDSWSCRSPRSSTPRWGSPAALRQHCRSALLPWRRSRARTRAQIVGVAARRISQGGRRSGARTRRSASDGQRRHAREQSIRASSADAVGQLPRARVVQADDQGPSWLDLLGEGHWSTIAMLGLGGSRCRGEGRGDGLVQGRPARASTTPPPPAPSEDSRPATEGRAASASQ